MDYVYILWTSDEWNSWNSARIYAVCADEKAVLDSIVDGVTSKAFDVNVKGDVRKALKEFPFREWSGRLHYPNRCKTPCFSYGDIRRVPRICASN